MVKSYNDEAKTSSDYYDDYERIYVVTPLSHNQFNLTLHHIQDAVCEESPTKMEQVSYQCPPKITEVVSLMESNNHIIEGSECR